MMSIHRTAFTRLTAISLYARGKLSTTRLYLTILLTLSMASPSIWADDTKIRFTATIDRIIGLEGANLSETSNEVHGELIFSPSNYLEPGFYDGHTWQNAVKQITFGAPINARFSGMGVTMYPDQNFISVFYNSDKCPHIAIVCAADGTSKFTLSNGAEMTLNALNYHIHQPYSEATSPQLPAVIERFIAHAGDGTTKALVRYHGENSREPILTILMTINAIQ